MKHSATYDRFSQSSDRRTFLRGLAGSVATFPILPTLSRDGSGDELSRASEKLTAGDSANESYWRLVKGQFPIKPQYIMLNAANLCPSPHMVRESVFRLGDDLDADVSFQSRAKFDTLREEARHKLAAWLTAFDDEIAIVRNTSEANNIIVNGLELKAGDEVVIFDQNHPTNNIAWDVRAARIGFTVKRVSLRNPPESVEEMLTIFQAALSPRTKVLSITDVSNTTGVKLPSKELCRIARDRGIYSHVDGAQTFGSLIIKLHELGCDSYSGSAHKWFMGPKEAGLLYIRRERIGEIWPSVVGVGWGDQVVTALKGARKFEALGQRDDAAVSAMGTTVDFHNLIGPARIEARIRELAAALKDGCAKLPTARLLTSSRPELSAGVCILAFDGKDSRKVYELLYSKHRIAAAATGGVRFCPHIYNTMEDIDRTVSALSQILKEA